MNAPQCPACDVAMEEGFMLDRGHANAARVGEWVEGEPERSFWAGIKLRGKERMPTATYRCPKCGLLLSYAWPT
jgi:hypothetical protein